VSRRGARREEAGGGSGLRLATEDDWLAGAAEASGPQRDYLTLVVGDEEYAIAIDRIREIIKVRPVTEVPHVPSFVIGIIAVRGTIVPVLDLRQRLRLATDGLSRTARFLIVAREEEVFGLLVDEVRQVVRLADAEIEPPPAMLSSGESDFIAGIGRPHGRMVILLALDHVLAFEMPHRAREKALSMAEARRLQGALFGDGR
jgi:purine-binding chemotaxis protein CheW